MSRETVATIVNRARQLLQAQSGAIVDRSAIERVIKADAPVVAAMTGNSFSEAEIEEAIRTLEMLFVVEQGPSVSLTNDEMLRPPSWYVGERRSPGPFMSRYLQKLEENNWPVDSVEALKNSTAQVRSARAVSGE